MYLREFERVSQMVHLIERRNYLIADISREHRTLTDLNHNFESLVFA